MKDPHNDESENTEPIDSTETEDAKILLADPGDYHRAQRLKEIHGARNQVRNVRQEGRDAMNNKIPYKLQSAVHEYALELEPIVNQITLDTNWPKAAPWDSFDEYCDLLGQSIEEHQGNPELNAEFTTATINESLIVYRYLNNVLAEIRPIIEEDDSDEWEV